MVGDEDKTKSIYVSTVERKPVPFDWDRYAQQQLYELEDRTQDTLTGKHAYRFPLS